ncbi:hypothetical protein PUR34_11385 [Streptomyces sp. JV185]|nr:hypothetical protein [Streptomyces sp. JV185]MEE1768749.1 hypothetical protein [Streptomyces sp. JV185]
MTAEEPTPYEIPGASGPDITLRLHKELCPLPASTWPLSYPRERRY